MINPHAKLIKENVQPKEWPKLSPSSINLFDQDAALWVLKHFYGSTSGYNVHAMRGSSLEEGLNRYLDLPHLKTPERTQEALKRATEEFHDLAFFWGDEDLLQDIEQKIPTWLNNCIEAMAEVIMVFSDGEMPKLQEEIETTIHGIPVRGFLDYSFASGQTDLKTATTLPSPLTRGARKGFLPAAKKANVRQQSVYNKATGKETSLLYVSPDGYYHHILSDEELAEAMVDVENIVKTMKDLLTMPIEDVIKNSIPNWKSMNYSFYWDDNLRRMADELWGEYKPEEKDGGY